MCLQVLTKRFSEVKFNLFYRDIIFRYQFNIPGTELICFKFVRKDIPQIVPLMCSGAELLRSSSSDIPAPDIKLIPDKNIRRTNVDVHFVLSLGAKVNNNRVLIDRQCLCVLIRPHWRTDASTRILVTILGGPVGGEFQVL